MAREYFKAFHSYLDAVEPLSDAECGKLFKVLLKYSSTGTVPDMTGNERFVFPLIKGNIDRDTETYESIVKKRSEAGAKGASAKASKSKQVLASASKCLQDQEKEEEKDKRKLFPPDSKPYKCALFLASEIKARLPQGKPADERQLQSWADSFDKVNRIDKYDWKTIGEVLEFSQSDSFWQKNILSGATFRKQFIKLYAKRSDSTG